MLPLLVQSDVVLTILIFTFVLSILGAAEHRSRATGRAHAAERPTAAREQAPDHVLEVAAGASKVATRRSTGKARTSASAARQHHADPATYLWLSMVPVVAVLLVARTVAGRGVGALAGLGAAVVAVMLHVTFARIIDERVFKGRVLVYGVGRNAETISQLRRRADRRGFVLIGFVRPPGESPGFFPAELAGFPERVLDGGWGFPSSAGASTSMRLWWRSTTGVASFRSASSSSAASPGLM